MITRAWFDEMDAWLGSFGIGRPARDVVIDVLNSARYQAMTADEKFALNLLIIPRVK